MLPRAVVRLACLTMLAMAVPYLSRSRTALVMLVLRLAPARTGAPGFVATFLSFTKVRSE